MEYFKDFSSYKKERLSITINYNAKAGSALYFKDTKLKNLQDKTINRIIDQINSLKNKNEYFDLLNILIKELNYRKLINNTSIISNNKTHNTINLLDILVDFYYYEFIDNKYIASKIEKVTVSFIQTSKWYNFHILINNVYTGVYLNFVSINDLQGYSPRVQIGIAYNNYINNLTPTENNNINKTNNIAKIPRNATPLFNRILENHVYSIHKYADRDELTKLNLVQL